MSIDLLIKPLIFSYNYLLYVWLHCHFSCTSSRLLVGGGRYHSSIRELWWAGGYRTLPVIMKSEAVAREKGVAQYWIKIFCGWTMLWFCWCLFGILGGIYQSVIILLFHCGQLCVWEIILLFHCGKCVPNPSAWLLSCHWPHTGEM